MTIYNPFSGLRVHRSAFDGKTLFIALPAEARDPIGRFSKFMPNGINCELLTEGAFREHWGKTDPTVADERLRAINPAADRTWTVHYFNRMDGEFGHSLAGKESLSQGMAKAARKMLMKYRRQLGDALMARIRGE